eukprot:jgi/Ulvmu1/4252/UM192_0012.1
MATKAPLQERHLENIRPEMETDWRLGGDRLAAVALKSTAHLSVKTECENGGKRSREYHSQSRANASVPSVVHGGSKKSRGGPAPGNRNRKKPAPVLPPGRPHLARRVGGIAPNGNPQCWYAPHESEVDPHRIAQRMKQVEFGKNSTGYKAYVLAVPRDQRRGDDPQTPDVRTKCSKRCFDGLLRSWRRRLHRYDPPGEGQDGQEDSKHERSARDSQSRIAREAAVYEVNGVRGAPERKLKADAKEPRSPDAASFATPETPTAMGPVPWEDIEKMSLCSPLWGDDKDSDISEPDSGDRVTIYTNELSPTPSELYCLQQAENQSELWGTPRSHLSAPAAPSEEHAGTPNSPYSPWAPWGNAKGSFADALRSPAGMLDLEAAPPGGIPIPTKATSMASAEPASTAAVPAREAAEEHAPAEAQAQADAPVTFGAAFANGMLRDLGGAAGSDAPAIVPSSLFGAGLRASRVDPPKLQPPTAMLAPAPPASQDLLEDMDLELQGQSISMRAMPQDGA